MTSAYHCGNCPEESRCFIVTSCYLCPNTMEMHEIYKPYGMMVVPPGKEISDFRGRWVCTEKDYEEISLHDLPSWCPLQTQAALREEGAKQEREEVLDTFLDRLWTSITIHPDSPEGKVIKTIVKSLRGQHESKSEPECGACQGPAPFVTMSSDKLIALAETEWTNRAERKQPAYDKRSWISGWFDGYFCKPKSDMLNGSTGAGNVSKMAGKIDKSLNPIPPNKYE